MDKKNVQNHFSLPLKQTPQPDPKKFLYWRKVFHFSGILFPLIWAMDPFRNLLPIPDTTRSILFVILFLALIFQVILEYLRFHFKFWQKIFLLTLGKLLKEDEHKKKIHGSIPYFFANLLLLAFFHREVAIVSMVFLIIGDPLAAYIGSRYGSWRFPNGKSFQGTFAAIVGASMGGMIFLLINYVCHTKNFPTLFFSEQINTILSLLLLFTGATKAFIVELFSGYGILDDNLTIPLSAAIFISLLFWLLGIATNDLFFDSRQLFLLL